MKDATEQDWDELGDRLEKFVAAWEDAADPPSLAAFLPSRERPSLWKLTLVELIKVDLEYRWQRGLSARLEDYLRKFPELATAGGPPSDLLYEEYHIRRKAGDVFDTEEFFARFPSKANELQMLLTVDGASKTRAEQAALELIDAGQTVDDFDLILPLGQGAFAKVFLARQKSMRRMVALKISAARGDEPQTMAQLDHPHIVRVYDQATLSDRQLRLLYMQYVPGGTLQQVIQHAAKVPAEMRRGQTLLDAVRGALDRVGESAPSENSTLRKLGQASWPEVVCRLGAQLARAIDYAHSQGILHRDVKPANVLLTAEATAKLADFNISFSAQTDASTPAAYFGGSLAYMSPEQLEAFDPEHTRRADELDGRADVYSLGVVLWELLYGHRPFGNVNMDRNIHDVVEELVGQRTSLAVDPAPNPNANDLSAQLQRVLLRCLEPDRNRRYRTGGQLARELLLCLQPRVQGLLRPAPASLANKIRQQFVAACLVALLIPNLLAAVFNYAYNRREIIDHLPGSADAFQMVMTAINALLFPLGTFVLWRMTVPIASALRKTQLDSTLADPRQISDLLARTLFLGQKFALVGAILWLLAGIAYPICLQAMVGGMTAWYFLHFVLSLAMCGLIACTYPYFLVTFLSVRIAYPSLLAMLPDLPDATIERANHRRVARQVVSFLTLAAAVPSLSVVMLALSESNNRVAMLVLSIIGGLGIAVLFRIYRAILRDLGDLGAALRMSEWMDMAQSGVESMVTGSFQVRT